MSKGREHRAELLAVLALALLAGCGSGRAVVGTDTVGDVGFRFEATAWPDGRGGEEPACGDGTCGPTESCTSCADDCGPCPSPCGDGTCAAEEDCASCPADCGPCRAATCPDGECSMKEGCSSCPEDCGPCPNGCPDEECEDGEDCFNCPEDCPDCGVCGDGWCGSGELCANCPQDCGTGCPPCGNGTCDSGEWCTTCPADCGNCCGNGTCDETESCIFCPTDCGSCCPNGTCDAVESCLVCPQDCGECCSDGFCADDEDCYTCPLDCGGCCGNSQCDYGESCAICPADCGACCPNGTCGEGETCASCPADCGTCPPVCSSGICEPGETCTSCPADCGACPSSCGGPCPAGQQCVEGPGGAFCTACDPAACGLFGVKCCPVNAPAAACTNTFVEHDHCGGCGDACGPDQLCNMGSCAGADTLVKCSFDPMQWWASPLAEDSRDITFAAFGDPHGADMSSSCDQNEYYDKNQNYRLASALSSLLPSVFWAPHTWPAGANFYKQGQPFDHVRGAIALGDLTHSGDEAIPAGSAVCRQYLAYRDAFGRCGNEGRLPFPIYEGYGNHDFPKSSPPGDQAYHPVVTYLDKITAAHRSGAAGDLYDDESGGTGHYAWRWDDIWFVNLDVKPGFNLEILEGTSPPTTRIVDPHASRSFLKEFLLSRTDSATRQIVVLAHYPLSSDRIDEEEKVSFCKLLYHAQHGTGDFTSKKLSMSYPVAAYIHGHDHAAPEYKEWACKGEYNSIKIPMFSAGTPLHEHPNNDGKLRFTVFRLGSKYVEAVGVGASPNDPTGPWTYTSKVRLPVMQSP